MELDMNIEQTMKKMMMSRLAAHQNDFLDENRPTKSPNQV